MAQATCSHLDCSRPRIARGMCGTHWARWRRFQGTLPPRPTACSVAGCGRGGKLRRGWCEPHYDRWKKHGSPTHEDPSLSVSERFWAKVERGGSDDCWPWLAARTAGGYGRFSPRHGETTTAQRFAYADAVAPIPDGMHIDHLCRNRGCVNPAHLEAVTPAENVRRGEAGRHNRVKVACPKGHPYDEANTYVYRRGRQCRACWRGVP